MKFQAKPIVVNAVQFKKDMGLEDGFAVYETEYPDEGHTFELSEDVDTTKMTIIQAAVQTPYWKVVSEGQWIVTFPDGRKEIWENDWFLERFEFVNTVHIDELHQKQYINYNGEVITKEQAVEIIASGQTHTLYTVSDDYIQRALRSLSEDHKASREPDDFCEPDLYAQRVLY